MCYGPFTRIIHWGPLTALGIIKYVTAMTIHCNGMWWPSHSLGGFLNSLVFMGFSGLTLYNFLSSMYHGPGYLPLQWHPANSDDSKHMQWCAVCQGFKAPRSHHCRKCGRCVLKMDHHCPWINNCVGWGNHAHFTAFLTFATLGCFQASVILACSLYRAMHRKKYLYYGSGEPMVHLGIYGVIMCIFALGLTIGVVIAVGMLLFFQLRAIVRNRTAIEDWILEKANYRRRNNALDQFIYPYNLGVRKNIFQVVNLSCQPIGDGVTWPVREGCDQFTLTREQISQKNEKRQLRTKLYKIVRPASGSWLPITQGLKVCCCPPYTDEPRIKLEVNDLVTVTRWRTHWLFGQKVQESASDRDEAVNRVRGWFPRRCAVEAVDDDDLVVQEKKKNK